MARAIGLRSKIYLAERKKLMARIDREIKSFFKDDPTFLPDEYRILRLAGKKRKEIDYDMCHYFR
ncbi:hypothetical protein D4S03_10935 [bacterium]|nr:MAG: hypothetical protein D4S03_10935 [bacterium]